MQKTKSLKSEKLAIGKVTAVFLTAIAMTFGAVVPAQAAVTVTAVSPAAGPVAGGTVVTITGTEFDITKTFGGDNAYVKFGTTNAATYTVVSATSITAEAPAGSAGTVAISVGGVSLASAFTYAAAPTITTVSPATGPLGGTNSVVITGTNFIGLSGAGAVTFGGTNATSYVVNSGTQITAVAPARTSGAVSIVVTAAGGSVTKTTAYTYVSSPPTISSIGTKVGSTAGGTTVVITGTNFHGLSGSSAVKFGSNNATSYTVNSPTQITAVTPAGVAGTVNVLVTAVDGTATLSSAFTYRASSSAVNATERVYFLPGRSEIRSSQYEAFAAIAEAVEGKTDIRISITSRRWSGDPATLGKARNTSVVRLLKLLGIDGANVTYTRFNTKASSGGATAEKNNRVTIAVSWTN